MPEALRDFWDTWHQPALGALHVMGIAWFGAAFFTDEPRLRRIGIAWLLLTGVALFALNPHHWWESNAFRIKLGLIAAALMVPRPRWLVLALWIAVIFLSRAIAYF